jgi:DNA-binding CsgD family transcriptional regulator
MGLDVRSRGSDGASSANPRTALYRPIFVGREAELQRLRTAYDEATEGRAALVAIAGEPGIGKTALCTQLATYATSRGGQALWGHCTETDSVSLAYLPLVQALDTYAASLNTEQLEQDLASAATSLARIVPSIRQRLGLHVEPAADPDEDRWRLFQAAVALLRSGTARQPMLLVLEDLHEADRGTLDLLTYVARNIADARLLVLATYRDVEVDRAHPLSSTLAELRRLPHFTRLGLHGLSVADVHQLYCEVRGQAVPLSRAQTVHHQTEGNPLFVQELLRYLVEVGLVVERGGAYVPKDVSLIDAEVPEGLRDIVGKRLNRLTERTNDVLHIAAVIGQEFRLDVLQSVSGLSDDVLFEALEEAQARAIIDESSGFGPSSRFRFTHAFFRQTLYEEVFAPRRNRWHRLIGSALEQVYSDQLDEHAGELAAHFAHSSDPVALTRALAFDSRAAEHAMRVYAYGEAARHLERALQVEAVLEVRQPSKRCDLLLALGDAMLGMDQSPRHVTAIAEEAFELAESNRDEQRAARAAVLALEVLSRPWYPSSLKGTPEDRKWVERVDRFAAEGTVERVYADIWIGMFATATGQPARVTAPLLRAVELARQLGDAGAYGAAAGFALTHIQALAEVDAVLALAIEFMSRSHTGIRVAHLGHALSAAGRLLLGSGDRAAAEQAWEELDRLAAESSDATVQVQALPNRSIRALLDGDLDSAADQLQVAARAVRDGGLEGIANPYFRFASFRALYYLGRANDSLLQEFPGERRSDRASRALLRAMLGRCDDVLALRSRFTGIEKPDDTTALTFLILLFEASVLCRDTATAEVLLDRMTPLADRLDGATLVSYGRLLGEAALLAGRPAQARDLYDKALGVCEKVHFRPELALIHLDIAALLLDHYPSEKTQAVDYLRMAIGEFELMHMQPSLDRALELSHARAPLQQSSSARRLPRRLPDLSEALTDREREVATLLAHGMSNREIATALVISESTAEVHVKHILSKLGLRSRSQVAAWAARHDPRV